jgi:hypothetical protein
MPVELALIGEHGADQERTSDACDRQFGDDTRCSVLGQTLSPSCGQGQIHGC